MGGASYPEQGCEFVEHLLCPGHRRLCVHHVTWCLPSPVTPDVDTMAQGDAALGPGSARHAGAPTVTAPLPSALLCCFSGSLCPWAVLPRGGPLTPVSEPPGASAKPHFCSPSVPGRGWGLMFTHRQEVPVRALPCSLSGEASPCKSRWCSIWGPEFRLLCVGARATQLCAESSGVTGRKTRMKEGWKEGKKRT